MASAAIAATSSEIPAQAELWWQSVRHAPDGPIDVIDMFSGCGGMSAGFKAINGLTPAYRIASAVDMDETANHSYEHNIGVRPFKADISKLARSPKLLESVVSNRRPNTPLVLIGCAPCQGFSSHRNRAGRLDKRNSLFLDFARIATKLKPEAIIVENVPELLTDHYWKFVEAARRLLERSGYYVHISVQNMAEFGVPQERFRALLLAMRQPFNPPHGYLERTHFRTVRDAIADLNPIRPGQRDRHDTMHYCTGHKPSTIETIQQIPKDGGSRPAHVGPACLRRAALRNGRAIFEDVYGRLFWDRPAITITASSRNPASGRFVHPEQDRGLTIREAAILQGFPRDYWFAGSLDERFRQIGNAVPPMFSTYLALNTLVNLFGQGSNQKEFDRGVVAPVGPSFSRLIPALKAGYRKDINGPLATQI